MGEIEALVIGLIFGIGLGAQHADKIMGIHNILTAKVTAKIQPKIDEKNKE